MGCHRLSAAFCQALGPAPGPSLRDVVNAIFYVSRGGSWRMLPKDFPPYQTVYRYFRFWSKDGTWTRVHGWRRLRGKVGRGAEERGLWVLEIVKRSGEAK